MRLLAVADEESKYLWDYYEPEKLRGYDMIIGCGDLSIQYMTFLATVAPVPVVYVHGNHDESYDNRPPTGALCIDDDVFCYKGYRFFGAGGQLPVSQWGLAVYRSGNASPHPPCPGQDRPGRWGGCAGDPCTATRIR